MHGSNIAMTIPAECAAECAEADELQGCEYGCQQLLLTPTAAKPVSNWLAVHGVQMVVAAGAPDVFLVHGAVV